LLDLEDVRAKQGGAPQGATRIVDMIGFVLFIDPCGNLGQVYWLVAATKMIL